MRRTIWIKKKSNLKFKNQICNFCKAFQFKRTKGLSEFAV